jgi:hypothetical protein
LRLEEKRGNSFFREIDGIAECESRGTISHANLWLAEAEDDGQLDFPSIAKNGQFNRFAWPVPLDHAEKIIRVPDRPSVDSDDPIGNGIVRLRPTVWAQMFLDDQRTA